MDELKSKMVTRGWEVEALCSIHAAQLSVSASRDMQEQQIPVSYFSALTSH